MVLNIIKNSTGGEIFVPKLKSFKVLDLAKAINEKNKIKIIGIRPGEKLHEQMISFSDSYNTVELKDYYVILPNGNNKLQKKFFKKNKYKMVKNNFEYSSEKNGKYLSVNELKTLIKKFQKNNSNINDI